MKLPKTSVLLIKDGQVQMKATNQKRSDTSYLINSVQKPLTATMAMQQVQNGKIKLNEKLSHFYPNLPGNREVTVKDLLKMTSGLELKPGVAIPPTVYTTDKDNLERLLAKTKFNQQLHGVEKYNSLDYVLLCGILSQVTHKTYEQLFRQTYIKGLNLKHTGFLWDSSAELRKINWQPGHYGKDHHHFVQRNMADAVRDAHGELGAGSVVMSAADLAKAIKAILGGQLLTAKSRRQLFKGTASSPYGGGFYNYRDFKGSNGAGEGYYTFLRTTNDAKTILIIQSNYTVRGKFGKYRTMPNALFKKIIKPLA